MWDLRPQRLIHAGKLVAARSLTPEEIQQYGLSPEFVQALAAPVNHDELPFQFRPTAETFRPNPKWHRTQIAEATPRNDWFAVTFHRTRLLLLKPDDEPLWQQLQQDAQQTVAAGLPVPSDTMQLFQSRNAPLPTKE